MLDLALKLELPVVALIGKGTKFREISVSSRHDIIPSDSAVQGRRERLVKGDEQGCVAGVNFALT